MTLALPALTLVF